MATTSKRVRGSSASTVPINGGQSETPKKKFSLALFEGGAAALLREHKLIPSEGDFREHWAFQQALDFFEIECKKLIPEYGEATTAINRFEMWLLDTDWVPEKPKTFTVNQYHIMLTIPVQSGTVSLGVDFTPLTDDIDGVIRELKSELVQTFNRNWKSPVKTGNNNQQASGPKKVKVQVAALRIQEKPNGKTYAFAMPASGPWTTYGIPLYPDVAAEMGIDLDLEAGEYEWDGAENIWYETKEDSDKPSRVLGYAD